MDVFDRLSYFISSVATAIELKSDDEFLKEEQRIYIKTHVSEIKIEPGTKSCKVGSSIIVKPTVTDVAKLKFALKILDEMPEVTALESYLSVEYSHSPSLVKSLMLQLCREILNLKLQKKEIKTDKLALTCIYDLQDAPIKWDVQVGIDGVYLEDDQEITLSSEVTVRQPRTADIEKEYDASDGFALAQGSEAYNFPSAYLCMRVKARNRADIESKVNLYFNILSLYKVASISRRSTRYIPESFKNYSLIIDTAGSYSKGTFYKYKLVQEEFESFKGIVPSLEALLAKLNDNAADSSKSILIAIQRYNDACSATKIEEQITSAITCLEALYLKRTERSELSHRLAQRCAKVLRLFHSKPPIKIYENLKQAYEIRSNFIHGGFLEKDNSSRSKVLAYDVLECSRLSLLVFLMVGSNLEKDSLLSKVDNSFLDSKASEKLDLILSVLNIPKETANEKSKGDRT